MRRWIWNQVVMRMAHRGAVVQAHRPPTALDAVVPVPIVERYPGLAGTRVWMTRAIPSTERPDWIARLCLPIILWVKRFWPLSTGYREPLEADPWRPVHDRMAKRPSTPAAFVTDDPLAMLALQGPFSFVTQAHGDGYCFDLRAISDCTPSEGFVRCGGLVQFAWSDDRLVTTSIALDGRTFVPTDPDWRTAELRALAGLNTHVTMVEHLAWVHLVVAGTFSMATLVSLPAEHPLRQMLQPFGVETARINNTLIDGLIRDEGSNLPLYAGMSLDEVNRALRMCMNDFHLPTADPVLRAEAQGQDERFGDVRRLGTLFGLFHDFTRTWCATVMPEPDAATRTWLRFLHEHLPHGLEGPAGPMTPDAVTGDQLAWLLAVYAYQASVQHHLVALSTRPHMTAFKHMPPSVRTDGTPDEGACAEKLNSVLVATVTRYRLLDPVPLPASAGAQVWRDLQAALAALDAAWAQEPAAVALDVMPRDLASSTHA